MNRKANYLSYFFVIGLIVVLLKTGWVTFQAPQSRSLTLTADHHNLSEVPSTIPKATRTPQPTSSLTATASRTFTPTMTVTPFRTVYPAYLFCHKNPSILSETVLEIKGNLITIIAQNQSSNWLYISVEGKHCWIYRYVDYLTLNPRDVMRLPVTEIVLTLPPP